MNGVIFFYILSMLTIGFNMQKPIFCVKNINYIPVIKFISWNTLVRYKILRARKVEVFRQYLLGPENKL